MHVYLAVSLVCARSISRCLSPACENQRKATLTVDSSALRSLNKNNDVFSGQKCKPTYFDCHPISRGNGNAVFEPLDFRGWNSFNRTFKQHSSVQHDPGVVHEVGFINAGWDYKIKEPRIVHSLESDDDSAHLQTVF